MNLPATAGCLMTKRYPERYHDRLANLDPHGGARCRVNLLVVDVYGTNMKLTNESEGPIHNEIEVLGPLLGGAAADMLDLGCGAAAMSRQLAMENSSRRLVCYEVDGLQHDKNLSSDPPANLSFKLGGAQNIREADSSFDWVFMYKSLHHVPLGDMSTALQEVARVLRPGGMAYISEPIFAGVFNDILRLFHDEQRVRQAAFDCLLSAVADGTLESVRQIFFHQPEWFKDFAQFEREVMGVSYNDYDLTDAIHADVRARFEQHLTPQGVCFQSPMRVDLLRKPN